MNLIHVLLSRLAHEAAVLVRVHATRGSVPREVGAWMAVFATDAVGSVGGGHLELQATQVARAGLHLPTSMPAFQRYALGPSLGQCCGGDVQLQFELFTANDAPALEALKERLTQAHPPVVLFGGGHVGRAVVQAIAETGGPVVVITGSGHARKDQGVPAVLALAAPSLSVVSVGQLESDPGPDAPYDFWIVTPPQPRDDPCAGLAVQG